METKFISYAEIEAASLVRKAYGIMTNDPQEFERDVAYVIALADRIKNERSTHAARNLPE